jgi:hypothetical protein
MENDPVLIGKYSSQASDQLYVYSISQPYVYSISQPYVYSISQPYVLFISQPYIFPFLDPYLNTFYLFLQSQKTYIKIILEKVKRTEK